MQEAMEFNAPDGGESGFVTPAKKTGGDKCHHPKVIHRHESKMPNPDIWGMDGSQRSEQDWNEESQLRKDLEEAKDDEVEITYVKVTCNMCGTPLSVGVSVEN